MKTNFSEIEKTLLKSAKTYGESGAFLANHEGKTVLSTFYGPSDKEPENITPVNAESRYLMPLDCSAMLALCAFILIDEGKMRLSDKLSRFIPEFEHAGKITCSYAARSMQGTNSFSLSYISFSS